MTRVYYVWQKTTSLTENLFVMIIHPFPPGRVADLGSNMRSHRSRRYDPGDYEWKGTSARLYCLLCVAITLCRIPEYLNDYSSMLLGSHCWHRGGLSDFHGASDEALVSVYWTKPTVRHYQPPYHCGHIKILIPDTGACLFYCWFRGDIILMIFQATAM